MVREDDSHQRLWLLRLSLITHLLVVSPCRSALVQTRPAQPAPLQLHYKIMRPRVQIFEPARLRGEGKKGGFLAQCPPLTLSESKFLNTQHL
jgi:hypothetical protein